MSACLGLLLRYAGTVLLALAYTLGYTVATLLRVAGHIATGLRATLVLLLLALARLLWP